MRKSKTVGSDTLTYYYNGDDIINESKNGSNTTSYLMGADGYICRRQSGQYEYYFKNAHGDVVYAMYTNGGCLGNFRYTAWGESVSDYSFYGGIDQVPIRYAGEYYDYESGMTYLRARYYDSDIKRFITEDPAKDGLNWYAYCGNNPVMFVDPTGLKDYIYTSQTEYYIENDWGMWEFLNEDNYYAEIDGVRYKANSKETVTLYDWNSVDTDFLNDTLDSLVNTANEKETDFSRVMNESVGGDLDFKLQLDEQTLYLANGVVYNRNEAGNFVWAYFLESKNVSGYISGALAQGGSLLPPLANMNGWPRLDEEWDRRARWAGVEYYYNRNDKWWIYFILYYGDPHP